MPVLGAQPSLESVNAVATSGTAQTIPNPSTGVSLSRITLTANCTITLPTPAAGASFTVALVQDGTGSRTVTWSGTLAWPSGTTPVLTTTAAKLDLFTFVCLNGTSWVALTAAQNV